MTTEQRITHAEAVKRVEERAKFLVDALRSREPGAIETSFVYLEHYYKEARKTLEDFTPEERVEELGKTLVALLETFFRTRRETGELPQYTVGDYGKVTVRVGEVWDGWRIILHGDRTRENSPVLDVLVRQYRQMP